MAFSELDPKLGCMSRLELYMEWLSHYLGLANGRMVRQENPRGLAKSTQERQTIGARGPLIFDLFEKLFYLLRMRTRGGLLKITHERQTIGACGKIIFDFFEKLFWLFLTSQ